LKIRRGKKAAIGALQRSSDVVNCRARAWGERLHVRRILAPHPRLEA
jgi:hypothetical protein